MGDFIKELNIIDFLGMMLPGSLLILLFSMSGFQMDTVYKSYFGDDCSEGVKITILLIGGYLVGMLVHELGDQIEKQLWKIRCFDPKTYAAKAVGIDQIYEKLECDKKNYKGGKYSTLQEFSTNKLYTQRWDGKILIGLILFCMIISSLLIFIYCNNVVLWIPGINCSKLSSWILIMCLILFALIVMIFFNSPKKQLERNKLDYIRQANSAIQSMLVNKGNYQKRQVFDGFHVTMRNLLIVVSIAEFYAYLFLGTDSKLYELLQNLSEYSIVGLILFGLMFVRYYHYSYLKYKYSFENYLSL